MRTLALSSIAFGLALASVQLTACSNSADDCSATATCTTAGSSATAGNAGKSAGGSSGNDGGNGSSGTPNTGGSTGSGGQGGGAGSECDGDVANDPTCWTVNELGVFVSSDDGDDDSGDGTREAPFKTIMKGVSAAAGKNVYVCLGTADYYEEKLSFSASAGDGARVYGGFECAGWTHSKTRYVGVASPEPTGVRIDGLKQGVVLENLRIEAADGAGMDASSFGALVTNSKGVVLRRVQLFAGDGLKGADGEAGLKGPNGSVVGAAPGGSDGCAATSANGEWGQVVHACGGDGESQGGPGGKGIKNTSNAAAGLAGSPTENVHPQTDINNGGPGEGTGASSLDGKPGTIGDAGTLGAAAAPSGVFSVSGYAVADGANGSAGYPGQGGGGGGASRGNASCFGASGGAGGMGGCGGKSGTAGRGGGASVGLLAWNSEVMLEASLITSRAGGAGGAGGPGGAGGAGAGGGGGGAEDGVSILAGGTGGKGGTGGIGGSGSGGSGGPSYALVFSGTKPGFSAPDTSLVTGDGGEAGLGGKVLDAKAPDGSVGESLPEFQAP